MITNKAKFIKIIDDHLFDIYEYSQYKNVDKIRPFLREILELWRECKNCKWIYNKKSLNKLYININDIARFNNFNGGLEDIIIFKIDDKFMHFKEKDFL